MTNHVEPEKLPMTIDTPLTPMAMLNIALQRNAGIDVLNKIMDLQERFEGNQARKAYDDAISAAKAEIKPIPKNRQSHNGKYADLAAIAHAVDPVLSMHGLSYRFSTKQDDKTIRVTCVVAHRAGYFSENTLAAPADTSGSKNAVQAIGSTATYLQRYTLKMALGLAEEDDTADDNGVAVSKDRWPRGSIVEPEDYAGGTPNKDTKPKEKNGNGRGVVAEYRKRLQAMESMAEYYAWVKETKHPQAALQRLTDEHYNQVMDETELTVKRLSNPADKVEVGDDEVAAGEGEASRPTISERAIAKREAAAAPQLKEQPPSDMARVIKKTPSGEIFDGPQWLGLLTVELDKCTTIEDVKRIKDTILLPAKGKPSKGDWEQACKLYKETFGKLAGDDLLRV